MNRRGFMSADVILQHNLRTQVRLHFVGVPVDLMRSQGGVSTLVAPRIALLLGWELVRCAARAWWVQLFSFAYKKHLQGRH